MNIYRHKFIFNILYKEIDIIIIKIKDNLKKCNIDFIFNDNITFECNLCSNYKKIKFYINILEDKILKKNFIINFIYSEGDVFTYIYNLYQLKYNLLKDNVIEIIDSSFLSKELNNNLLNSFDKKDDILILTKHILNNIRSEYFDIYVDILQKICILCEKKKLCYPLIKQGVLQVLFSFIETNSFDTKRYIFKAFRLLCFNTHKKFYDYIIDMNIIYYIEKNIMLKDILLSKECALLLNQLCIFCSSRIFKEISKETILWLKNHSDITLNSIGNILYINNFF
jgi:hypothetical protein